MQEKKNTLLSAVFQRLCFLFIADAVKSVTQDEINFIDGILIIETVKLDMGDACAVNKTIQKALQTVRGSMLACIFGEGIIKFSFVKTVKMCIRFGKCNVYYGGAKPKILDI